MRPRKVLYNSSILTLTVLIIMIMMTVMVVLLMVQVVVMTDIYIYIYIYIMFICVSFENGFMTIMTISIMTDVTHVTAFRG